MQPLIQSGRNYLRSGRPIWFAGLYVLFTWAWIFLNDKLVAHLSLNVAAAARWDVIRHVIYVIITSSVIYEMTRRLGAINRNLENIVTSRTAALTASEKDLRTREEWMRRLVASLPDVAWTTSEDFHTIFVSPNVVGIFGFSVEEVYDSSQQVFLCSLHPDDRQRVIDNYRALFEHGRPFDEEFRARHKEGRWIWVHDRAVQTHTEGGVLYADGVLTDITARKEAEYAREAADKRYRLLFERNLAGVFRAEVGGKLLDCNPALVRMLGYDSSDQLLGRASAEILYEPAEQEMLLHSLAKTGAISNVEIRLRRNDGAVLWGLHNVNLLAPEDGGPPCIEGMVIDVTERKQTVSALSQQLSLMQAITSTAPDALFMLDTEGCVTFMNPAGERMLGYTTAELQGKVLHDVCHCRLRDGSPLPQSKCIIAQATASGNTLSGYEDVHFRKDGTAVDVSFSCAPLWEGNQLAGSVLMLRDITRRKLAEQQYQSLQEQFLHAQKMEAIGRLAGGVAHDFNNLLQVINGYSSLIVDESGHDSALAKKAGAIHEAGARAARLTQQLLDFSRKDPSDPLITSLDRTVKEIIKMVRTLVGEDIELNTQIHSDGICVKISSGQLEQLIMNLVVNARDAMPKGGKLRIETNCLNLDEQSAEAFGKLSRGAYAQISVADNGCGMDTDTMRRAFEPFFTTKERGKGTGLGLSTVYGIVTQNGGGIQIESTPGEGTTFRICLPVAKSKPAFQKIDVPVAMPRGTESILLAEDEEGVRSLIGGQLSGLGYQVMEACDGLDALQLARGATGAIDLLISDVIMPKMGGPELSKRIREIWPAIKIIQISGYNDTQQYPSSEGSHAIRHLQKPFNFETLAGKIREVIDG